MLNRKRSIFPFCLLLLHSVAWTLLVSGPVTCSAASLSYSDAIRDIVEVFKTDEEATRRILDLLAQEKAKLAKNVKELEGNEGVTVPEEDPNETLETVSSLDNNLADNYNREGLNEEIRIKREDLSESVKQSNQGGVESNIPIDTEGKLDNITQKDSLEEKTADNLEIMEAPQEVPREVVESLETIDQNNEKMTTEQGVVQNEPENEGIFPRVEGMNRGNLITLSRNEQGFGSEDAANPTEQISKMPSAYEMALRNEKLSEMLNKEKEINYTKQDNAMNFNEFSKTIQPMVEQSSTPENIFEVEVASEIGKLLMAQEDKQNVNTQEHTSESPQSQTKEIPEVNSNVDEKLSENESTENRSDITNKTEKIGGVNEDTFKSMNPEAEDLGSKNINENVTKSEISETGEFNTTGMKDQLNKEKSISSEEPITPNYIHFNESENIASERNNNNENEDDTLDSILEEIKDPLLENIKSGADIENNANSNSKEETKSMIDNGIVNRKIIKEDNEANELKENNDNMKSAGGEYKEINNDIHKKLGEEERKNDTHTVEISSSALRKLLLALKGKNNIGNLDEIEMLINNAELNSTQDDKLKSDTFIKLETKEKNDSNKNMSDDREGDEKNKNYETGPKESDMTLTEKQLSDLKREHGNSMVQDEDKSYMVTSTVRQFPDDSNSETRTTNTESRNENVATSIENQPVNMKMSKEYTNIHSEEHVPNVEMTNADDLAPSITMASSMDMKNDGEIMTSIENENVVPTERNGLNSNILNDDNVISSDTQKNNEGIIGISQLGNNINNTNKDDDINEKLKPRDSNFKSEDLQTDKEALGFVANNESSENIMNERFISNEDERNRNIDDSTANDSATKNEDSESKTLEELEADEILNLIKNLKELQDSTRTENKENIEREELEKDILNTIEETNGNEIADEVKKRFLEVPNEEISSENEEVKTHDENRKNTDESIMERVFDNIKTEAPENSTEHANIIGTILDAVVSTTENVLNHSSTKQPKEELYVLPNEGKGPIVFITSLNGLKDNGGSFSMADRKTQEELFDKAETTEEISSETPMATQVNDLVSPTENNEEDTTIKIIPVFEVINSEGNKTKEDTIQDEPTSEATSGMNKAVSKGENGDEEVKDKEIVNLENSKNTPEPTEENKEKLEAEDNSEDEKNKEGIH